jgi:hypothetical protein
MLKCESTPPTESVHPAAVTECASRNRGTRLSRTARPALLMFDESEANKTSLGRMRVLVVDVLRKVIASHQGCWR